MQQLTPPAMSSNANPILLVFEAFLVLAAAVVNALDPSYQAYYSAFGTLVTVQAVTVAVGWAGVHHAETLFLGTLTRAFAFICFVLSVFATVQASRDLGHCLENTGEDRSNANACIDLYSSYAALDGPHGVQNACATLGKPIASVLGGVCLNVEYEGTTGTALLVLQVIWPGLLLVINGYMAFKASLDSEKKAETLKSVQVAADAPPPGYNNSSKEAPVARKVGAQSGANKRTGATTRLMRSVYYHPTK